MKLSTNLTLDLRANTFRSEAEAIVQTHPDAILTEALGAADPTLFSEIKQLNGGKMIPVIGTSAAISPAFFKSVAAAVGASTFVSGLPRRTTWSGVQRACIPAFSKALLSQQGKVPGRHGDSTSLSAPGGVHLYDGINLAALAMIMSRAHPERLRPDIIKIGNGVRGRHGVLLVRPVRHAALKAGKAIRYEGPGRADQLRQLPRLDGNLPGRYLHATGRSRWSAA